MHPTTPATWLAAALCAGTCPAQATWIVDASGGAGAHFTTLPAAVAQARSGDKILVRSGFYSAGFSTDKGLTIAGQPDFLLLDSASVSDVITVHDVPAGETFTLAGCFVLHSTSFDAVEVRDCAGRVFLQALQVQISQSSAPPGAALRVTGSAAVVVTESALAGNPGVDVAGAALACTGSSFRGTDSFPLFGTLVTAAGVGLGAANGTVSLSRCDVTGGTGYRSPVLPLYQPGRPAVAASQSTLLLTGDPSNALRAGLDPDGNPIPAIATASGTVELDPELVVVGAHGGPPLAGGASLVARQIASFAASGGVLGDTVRADIASPAGDLVAIFLGLPAGPQPSPFGPIWFTPAPAVPLVFAALQPASGVSAVSFAVPLRDELRGVPIVLQGANYSQVRAVLEMTDPAVLALR